MCIRLLVRCYLIFLLAFGTFDHCMCSLPITRTDPHAYCFEYLARNHAKTYTSILLWVLVVPWVRKGQPWDHLNLYNVSLLCKKKKKVKNQLSRVLRLPLISLYQISSMQNCVGPTSVGMNFPQVKKIAGPFLGRLFKACKPPHNKHSCYLSSLAFCLCVEALWQQEQSFFCQWSFSRSRAAQQHYTPSCPPLRRPSLPSCYRSRLDVSPLPCDRVMLGYFDNILQLGMQCDVGAHNHGI